MGLELQPLSVCNRGSGAGFVSIGKSGSGDFPDDSAPLLPSAGVTALSLSKKRPCPAFAITLVQSVNHTLLVASQEVIERATTFLRSGRFLRQVPVQQ